MPILCVGSFGVATSTSLRSLFLWRLVQAFGCAGGVSVGAAVIGDIYRVEQRGTAMGIFFGVTHPHMITLRRLITSCVKATLLGVALAPITGGSAAHYWTWRGMHSLLGVWGFIEMALFYLFFPETSHPHPGGTHQLTTPFKFVWINPFSGLWLLRSPNIMAVVRLYLSFDRTLPEVLFSDTSKYISNDYGIW